MTTATLDEIRRSFAEEVRAVAHLESGPLVEAFAHVPRERFLGDGPWQIVRALDRKQPYRTTEDADVRHIYHDVGVALDPSRGLNNGQPSALALWRTGSSEAAMWRAGGCGAASSSSRRTWSALAILTSTASVGLAAPDSRWVQVARGTPAARAICCCDSPRAVRSALMLSARWSLGSWVGMLVR
jgi:hypothetical protein